MTSRDWIEKAYHSERQKLIAKAKLYAKHLPLEAEDLVQDAVVKSLKAFTGDSLSHATRYLYKALWAVYVDAHRLQGRRGGIHIEIPLHYPVEELQTGVVEMLESIKESAGWHPDYELLVDVAATRLEGDVPNMDASKSSRVYRARKRIQEEWSPYK